MKTTLRQRIYGQNDKILQNKGFSAGQMHNDILSLLKQAEFKEGIVVNSDNKKISREMIDIVEKYLNEKQFELKFSKLLDTVPDLSPT